MLHKPTLLLVRPELRQSDDRQTCERAGWQALPFAPIRLVRDDVACCRLPAQLQDAAAVFWVSPSAVEIAAPYLNDPIRQNLPHIAVGRATAAALKSAGCLHIHHHATGNDSLTALTLPIWQTLLQDAKVWLVRGQDGREELSQALRQRGLQVHYAAIYQRQIQTLNWQDFMNHSVQAAWVTSSEMAQQLFIQAPQACTQKLKSLLYFTHHARIVATLRQCGATHVHLFPHLSAALTGAASFFQLDDAQANTESKP